MGRRASKSAAARKSVVSMRVSVGLGDDVLLRSEVGRGAKASALTEVAVDDGQIVTLVSRKGIWAHIKTATGDEGWMLQDHLQDPEEAAKAAKEQAAATEKEQEEAEAAEEAKEEEGAKEDEMESPTKGETPAEPSAAAEDSEEPSAAASAAAAGDEGAPAAGDVDDDDSGESAYVKGPGMDSVEGRWAQLVIRCAKALKRSAKNLPVYVSEGAVKLCLAALGTEVVAKILEHGYATRKRELTEEEGKYVVSNLSRALKHSSLASGQNGAKAALNSVKFISGVGNVSGSQVPGKARKTRGPTVKISCAVGAAAAAEGVAANISAQFLQSVAGPTDDADESGGESELDESEDPANEPALGWLTGKTVTRAPRTSRAARRET